MERFNGFHPEDDRNSGIDSQQGHLSRRAFLLGGLAVAATISSDTQKSAVDSTKGPTNPGKKVEAPRLTPYEQAVEKIRNKVAEIEKDPTVARAKNAKNSLSSTSLSANGEGIALYFSVEGQKDEAIAVASVEDMRRHLHDRKNPTYVVFLQNPNEESKGKQAQEKSDSYTISISDMHVDIGVSSRLSVTKKVKGAKHPATVLAVKRARYLQSTRAYGEYVTYTPAHASLRTPEVIRLGKEYVNTVLGEATKLLAAAGANKDVLALSTEVAKRVAIIEHIDPYEFAKKSKDNPKEVKSLYEIALAEYSLNLGTAYNHLVNASGAGGMMQIIPQTYRDVRKQIIKRKWLREEDMPENIDVGRKNPLISAVISIALSYLNYEIREKTIKELPDKDKLLVLASMYNGSPKLLRQILEDGAISRILRSHKKGAKTEKQLPIRDKLLKNGKGNKLAGTDQTENENYIQKFIAYDASVA